MKLAYGVACVLMAACGGDDPAACELTTGTLPTEGPLADPRALPLPETCVEGGLDALPGRWFVVDPTKIFTFAYPKFEGACTTGFTRAFYREDDHDLADGFTFHTWSDGTRFYYRYHYRFDVPDAGSYDIALAFAACLQPDGTLAAVQAGFDTDNGERIATMTGTRFGRKDDLARGLALVGELGTWGTARDIIAYNVVVDGTYAYVVGATGFEIIDVADPAAPVHVGHVDGRYNDVRVVRGADKIVAYLSPIDDEPTAFVDVTDPAAPVKAGELPEYSHSVQVVTRGAQTLLYLATYSEVIPAYDVTAPLAPVRLGAATVPGESEGVHDLFVDDANARIYANYTTGGTVALDVSMGLANAVEIGRAPSAYSHASWAGTAGGRAVVLHGDEGMTKTEAGGAHLRVLDGDPASATFMGDIGKYQTRPEVGIHNFQLVGDKVYIAYYQDGVRVVDLADPTAPREVAHYNTWDPETALGGPFEGAIGIRVVGDRIYVADTERGLLIFEER